MALSREAQTGLVLLGAAALAFVLLSPYSPLGGVKAPPGSAGDAVWRQGYPVGHERLCKPGDIDGGPLFGPHPLYSRPPRCGHHRTGLIECGGWDWILNPPTEVTVP
jgi:hypothetical protein